MENALRTAILGSAFAYERLRAKAALSQHGAAGRSCGIVPTRRAGAPPEGPPIPTYPAASLRWTRALELSDAIKQTVARHSLKVNVTCSFWANGQCRECTST